MITVRCDASLEEGWYYEGAGLYRHVRLHKAGKIALKPYSLCINAKKTDGSVWTVKDGTCPVRVDASCVKFDCLYADASVSAADLSYEISFEDAQGIQWRWLNIFGLRLIRIFIRLISNCFIKANFRMSILAVSG